MSKLILSDSFALRSWNSLPCALYEQGRELPFSVEEESFALLCRADGTQELEDSPLLRKLLEKGFLRSAEHGEQMKNWQRYRRIDMLLRPYLALEITERCNYRCRHCFNAEDNAVPRAELGAEEIETLLSEAVDCGIQNVLFTGGEPLVHPDFFRIVEAVAERGMNLYELNTNGALLDQSILSKLRECGFMPTMKISFDGLGFHDWMRGVDNAEEKTLNAISLCIREGFHVKVQMNLNRLNADAMLPSLRELCVRGVKECRIIRTTEAPRWEQNAGNGVLSWEEYFEIALAIARAAAAENLPLKLNFWEYLTVMIPERAYYSDCVRYKSGAFSLRRPQCKTIRGMPAVGADGELYPCLQMSGFMKLHGVKLGNIRNHSLRELLEHSAYAEFACRDIAGKIRKNTECFLCSHLSSCAGGCPAISQLTSGDFEGCDRAKCLFFHHGWYGRLAEAFPDWDNLMPVE